MALRSGKGRQPRRWGAGRRLLAVDVIALAYLVLTGAYAASSLEPAGVALAGAHAAAVVAVVWAAGRFGAPGAPGRRASGEDAGARPMSPRSVWRFVRLTWPVLLTPLLYHELSVLSQLHGPGYHDAAVQAWEEALFGVQLSAATSRWLSSRLLSELFHLGYLSYYLLVPGSAVVAYLAGGEEDLGRFAVATAAAFFFCYLWFAAFPVVGPRYLFAPPEGPPASATLYGATRALLEAGSSKGTAFPSSHVAATIAGWLVTRHRARAWFLATAPLVLLLTLGTVYGGYHYGVDALAGVAVGVGAYLAVPRLRRLGPRSRQPSGH